MLTHKSIACTLRLRWLLLVGKREPGECASEWAWIHRIQWVREKESICLVCQLIRENLLAEDEKRGTERETARSAFEKCKHKNKLDVTRSEKRRRREIESFKNEHRKIYLGEKKSDGKHGDTMMLMEWALAREKFRWTESIRCVTVCLLWNVRTPSLPSFLLLHLQLPVCLSATNTLSKCLFSIFSLFHHLRIRCWYTTKLLRNNLDLSLLPFILIYSILLFLYCLLSYKIVWHFLPVSASP